VTEGAAGWQEATRGAGYRTTAAATASTTFTVRRSGGGGGGGPGSATGRVGAGAGVRDVTHGTRDLAAVAAYNAAAEAAAAPAGAGGVGVSVPSAATGAAPSGDGGGERAFIDFGTRLGGGAGAGGAGRRQLHTRTGSGFLRCRRGLSTSATSSIDLRRGSPVGMVLPELEEALGPAATAELEHRVRGRGTAGKGSGQ
jgi:hypothetical protein